MSTAYMEGGNHSSPLPVLQDFSCCCSISREEFQSITATALLIFNNIVVALTSISATIGNVLVLVSIWRTPSLHSPSNVLIFSLAMSDLGVGLIVEPLALVYTITQVNNASLVFCNAAVVYRFAAALLIFTSVTTVTAVSIDMYLALHLHLRYRELVTVTRMTRVLVGIWFFSVTASLFNVWYRERMTVFWAFLILLCLLVTTTAYFKVFKIVRHHQALIQAQPQVQLAGDGEDDTATNFAQQKKASISKFLIYCLLVVCYLPFCVMSSGFSFTDRSAHVKAIYDVSFVLVYCNSTLNPFIYCWRFQKIRVAVIETAKKMLGRPSASEGSRAGFPEARS